MNKKIQSSENLKPVPIDSKSSNNSKTDKLPGKKGSHHKANENFFVPNLFKANPVKPTLVKIDDPFITDHSAKEYCSLFSTLEQDNCPIYLQHFKDFTDNVLDIPSDVFNDIAKVHIEREEKFKELEGEEDQRQQQLLAQQLKEKNSMDSKVKKILNTRQHYVKRYCPVKIPFKSTLSHSEHDFYIRCFLKFQIRSPINALEEKEYEQYLSMQNRVFDEQSCLMNFSFKVSQLVLDSYNNIPKVIDNYISEYVSHRCERAFDYPHHYKGEIEIPLKTQIQEGIPEHFQFNHLGHLLSLGNIPWIFVPEHNIKCAFPVKDDSLLYNKNPKCDDRFDKSSYLYKCPVSEDPNAEYLAKTYNVSLVITPSAFKTIVDNQEQPYDKEWNIPVKIRSYKTTDENGKEVDRRIIYIDKPLVRKSWLPLQKKYTFFKTAAKVVFSKNFYYKPKNFRLRMNSSSYVKSKNYKRKRMLSDQLENDLFISEDEDDNSNNFDKSGNKKMNCNDDDKSGNKKMNCNDDNKREATDNTNNALDTNCREKTPKAAIPPPVHYVRNDQSNRTSQKTTFNKSEDKFADQHQNQAKGHENKDDNAIGENTGFLDNLLGKQDSFLKLKASPGSTKGSESADAGLNTFNNTRNPHNRENLKPWYNTIHKNFEGDFKVKDCPPGESDTNVHYQLFSFENMVRNPGQEEYYKPVRILVRHSVHGLSKKRRKVSKEDPVLSSKAFVLHPKVENQIYFGAEVNSMSEIVQQWSDLLLRPNTSLLEVRVCTESASIVMTKQKHLELVLKEGKQQHINFNPQLVFSTFNTLLNTLMKMSSGDYLLHHSSKTGAFMKLMKSFNSDEYVFSSLVDLEKIYSDKSLISRQYRSSPWLAIDTGVFTPFHLVHHKIPATFPMENEQKLKKWERTRRKMKAQNKLSLEGYQ